MTMDELMALVPGALVELTHECIRRVDDYGPESQHNACHFLALRSVSILKATAQLLKPGTFDSWDILARAFLESRDLLTTFRFDDQETRKTVARWFKSGGGETWKPDHKKCEDFLNGIGARDLQLAKRWGMLSAISHPTYLAAKNSVAIVTSFVFDQERPDLVKALEEKKADFMLSVSTLIATMVYENPAWIRLGFDTARMPTAERVRTASPPIVTSILGELNAAM
jgi:hypothetical protein